MASQDFSESLMKAGYNFDDPLEIARFQKTVEEFMTSVRDGSLGGPSGRELMDKFCKLVDDREVWHWAQTVVPEFRYAREEQVHERTEGGNEDTCLNYVLSKLSFLPPPRRDVLITEQDIFLQSHRHDVEYLVTGGRGKRGATSSQLDEIEERCSQVEAALLALQEAESGSAEEAGSGARNMAEEEKVMKAERE